MNDAARVRVEIRRVPLTDTAPCEPSEGGVFVALDDPPPVRSILAITAGDEAPRALEVTAVVEVAPEGGARGFYGRFIEDDALARFERVGTEHLSDGEPEPAARGEGETAESDDAGPGTQMAMPAPVVDPDDSEPIDLDTYRSGEHEAAPSSDADDSGDAEDGADAEPEGGTTSEQTTSDGEDDGARKGKRRRGRKRR